MAARPRRAHEILFGVLSTLLGAYCAWGPGVTQRLECAPGAAPTCHLEERWYGLPRKETRFLVTGSEAIAAVARGKGNREGEVSVSAARGDGATLEWMSAEQARAEAERLRAIFDPGAKQPVIVEVRGPLWWLLPAVLFLGFGVRTFWELVRRPRS